MSDLAFTIGEVAAMLGISPHTIRAWERRHLVVRPSRTISGQRRYSADDVELLRQIKHERHVHGLSMRVATLAAQGLVVPDAGDANGAGNRAHGAPDPVVDPLRMVADLVAEVVVVVDGRGRISHANTAFVRFCDVLPSQLRGMAFADFVDPFDRAKAVLTYKAPLRQRRQWELNLRGHRRQSLFSFGCWPVPTPDGTMLVLVGTDMGSRSPALAVAAASAAPATVANGSRPSLPAPLRLLLDGVADPVRTLLLLRRWLDATPFGVVLTQADPDLTIAFANRMFARWMANDLQALDGRSWIGLAPFEGRERLAAAAVEAARSAQPRTVLGPRPVGEDGDAHAGAPIWDVEILPVTEVGGAVTHLLLVVSDVTAETEAAGCLRALAACTPAMRQSGDARELLAEAARHAQTLLPNAGSLVAAAPDREREGVSVVAASGAWARAEQGGEHRLRLALVRDVIRTCASMELQRAGGADAIETLRIVPVAPALAAGDRREALGALAFSRYGPATFSADDRSLIDEFAGRVGLAMRSAELLSPPARRRA